MAARYFRPEVVGRYSDAPERYRVSDSAFDGEISTRDQFYLSLPDEDRANQTIRIRYNKRKLATGGQVLVAWLPDFDLLPPDQRRHWEAHEVVNPSLKPVSEDREYQLAIRQNFEGEFLDTYADPVVDLSDAIQSINRLSPIFRHVENPLLGYPHTNNERQYSIAHAELYKLVGSGNLNTGCIKRLLKTLGVEMGKSDRPWALFKALTTALSADQGVDMVTPLELVPKQRSPAAHEIRDYAITEEDYVERFKNDCREVAAALRAFEDLLRAHVVDKETCHA